jgi:hypothetical protein
VTAQQWTTINNISTPPAALVNCSYAATAISRTLLQAQLHWAERHLWRSSTVASHVASSRFVGTSHERWELILKWVT